MKSRSGFTIVELLIVIVVIAILAAITIVAYNGVQTRARDSARTSDVRAIQKALELYKAEHGRYPARVAIGSNTPTGFTGRYGTSYSYSVDTNKGWLKGLIDSDVVKSVPVDPINDNDHYYIYWASDSAGFGACTEPFYMLAVYGYESAANIPEDSRSLDCTGNGQSANWVKTSSMAIFSNTKTP